jgi:hypothetical protein
MSSPLSVNRLVFIAIFSAMYFASFISLLVFVELQYPSFVHGSLARRIIVPRQDVQFYGGFALRSMTCPSDFNTCSAKLLKGQPTCCPKDTECVETNNLSYGYMVCCPKGRLTF